MAAASLRRMWLWCIASMIVLAGWSVLGSETASAASPAADPGCETTSLAAWGKALPVETRSESGETPCYTFSTTTSGVYLLRLSSEWSGSISIADAVGNTVASTWNYSDTLLPANLDAAKSYTVYLSPNQAGRYELGVFRLAESVDCAILSSTAWDADATTLSFADSVSAVHCRQVGGAAGDVVRIVSEAHVAVFNKAGNRVCDGPYSGGAFDCALSGTGPWQVVAFGDQRNLDSASLWLSSYANSGGCTAIPLAKWGQALPLSSNRTSRPADCFHVSSASAGRYLLRLHQTVNGWDGRVWVYDTSGEFVAGLSSSEQERLLDLKADTSYVLLATGEPAGRNSEFKAGLFRAGDATGCDALPSTAWDAAATTLSFADDAATVHCRQVTGTSNTTVRIGRTQSSYLMQSVFNKAGNQVCTTNYWSAESFDCQLTGTGPWQVVTYENTYYLQAVPDSVSFWVNSYATTSGCTSMPLASWGQNLPLVTSREDDLSDCVTVTTGAAGKYVLRVSQANWQWGSTLNVREATGVDIGSVAASSQSLMLDLKASHTYKIIVTGNPAGRPADYSAGLFRVAETSGCDALASTAWDASETTMSFVDDAAAVHCRQVAGTAGSTVRISRNHWTYLTQMVINKAGGVVCSAGYWTHGEFDCQLSGSGPWQVVSFEDTYSQQSVPPSVSMWVNSYATTSGCAVMPLAKWGQPLPLAATREDDANDCFIVTTGAAGKYLLRANQASWQWGLELNVRDATGVDNGSLAASSQVLTLDLKASHTYKVILTGDPAGRAAELSAGLFRAGDTTGCDALTSTAWDATASNLSFSDDPAAVHCRQVSATSGDRIRISRSQTQYLSQSVINKGGNEVCAAGYWTGATFDCQLTGTGPWQVLTHENTYYQPSVPSDINFWVNSYATTTGCTQGLDTTASMIAPRREVPRTNAPRTCLISNLARNSRVRMDAQVQNRESSPWEFIDANGDEQCRGDAYGSGIVNCDLRGRAPYRMLLGGAQDQVFEVAAHRITDAVGCHALTSIASGIAAQIGDLSREASLQCFKFDGGAGDQLKLSAINPNVADNRYTVELFDPDGNSLGVLQRWEADRTFELQQPGTHLALLSLTNSMPGRFELAAECLNPACGPDVLTIASVNPGSVGSSSDVTVNIRGKGLTNSSTVLLSQGGVTLQGVTGDLTDGGRGLDVNFDLSNRSGKWMVRITNPDGQSVELPNGLTIATVRPAEVSASLVALDRFVAGRAQTYSIVVENKGNTDALAVPVILDDLPVGTKVVPKFDIVLNDPKQDKLVTTPFDADTMLYQGSDRTMLPLLIGRLGPGERRELAVEVTVTRPGNFTPTLYAKSCTIGPSSPSAPAKGSASTIDATACGYSLGSLVGSFIGNGTGACATLAMHAVVNGYLKVSHSKKTSLAANWMDFTADGLGCVAAFLPGSGPVVLAKAALTGVATGLSASRAMEACLPRRVTAEIRSVASLDPNEIVGPAGGGSAHAIRGDGTHRYAIYFENAATATAPAQEVRISNQLDPAKFDLSTLRFTGVQFGSRVYTPQPEAAKVDHTLDLASSDGQQVEMKASVAPTGLVTWSLRSIDPITGDIPADPMVGFLPPNTNGTEGQGLVSYDVALKDPKDGGTLVNTASIVFDLNPAIQTNTWSNVIDRSPPTAAATSPGKADGPFPVVWSSQDARTAISAVSVYVSIDGGDYSLWKTGDATGSDTYPAVVGHRYGFSAVATDLAGNVSLLPVSPHTVTSTVPDPITPVTPPPTAGPAPTPLPPGSSNPQPVASSPVPEPVKTAQSVPGPPRKGKRRKTIALAPATSAGLAVSWRAAPAKVCKIAGGKLKLVGKGKCLVTAAAPGNVSILPLSRTFAVKVR